VPPLGARLDVPAIDTDSWRAEETPALRGLAIWHFDHRDLGLQPELPRDLGHQLTRLLVIRAALEVEDLHQRPTHGLRPSIRQQAATWSALSASSDSASESISATR
jgi:hypothetical protein